MCNIHVTFLSHCLLYSELMSFYKDIERDGAEEQTRKTSYIIVFKAKTWDQILQKEEFRAVNIYFTNKI